MSDYKTPYVLTCLCLNKIRLEEYELFEISSRIFLSVVFVVMTVQRPSEKRDQLNEKRKTGSFCGRSTITIASKKKEKTFHGPYLSKRYN